MKTLSKAVALASLVSASALTAQVANAEVEYSAEAATSYLYRGQDQGASGLISGAVDFSHDSGAYAGLWAAGAGGTPEYDLYAGFALETGDVSVDVGAVTYVYPGDTDGAPLDGIEAYVNVGFQGASLSYNIGLESLEDSSYLSLGYEMDAYSVTYGMSDDGFGAEYSHIDFGVVLSDDVSLTISQSMDDSSAAVVAAGDAAVEDTQVVLTFALPIK
jgi:uncharacterized protein (TIGR02001 family)